MTTLKRASENNNTTIPSTGPIKIELVRSYQLTRMPCHVCGGCTEKVNVWAEGPERLRVCETCLKHGDIDRRLTERADNLEKFVVFLRTLIGRLEVPTYAAWQAAEAEEDRLFGEEYEKHEREQRQEQADDPEPHDQTFHGSLEEYELAHAEWLQRNPQSRSASELRRVKAMVDDFMRTPPPEAAQEYVSYASAWIDDVEKHCRGLGDDVALDGPLNAARKRWDDEKGLRNAANVPGEDREALLDRLNNYIPY